MALKWMLPPARVDEPELLDEGVGTTADVQNSLDDLWRIHRWGGGLGAITNHLYPRLLAQTQPLMLLDMGTGAAQIPAAIAAWCNRQQRPARILALDFSTRNLEIAQNHIIPTPNTSPLRKEGFTAGFPPSLRSGEGVRGRGCVNLLQADATQLPLAPASVDYVISSLFLHHFPPETVVHLLRSAWTVARRGLVISDAVRNRLSLAAFYVGQPIFARSYLTRHDGVVSIRRAYTPAEMLTFAHEAGLRQPHIYRNTPWQMTLVADKA